MKKLGIIIMGVAVFLGITNPNKAKYIDYFSHNLCNKFEGLTLNGCQTIILLQKDNVKNILQITSKQNNFLLFSVFETDIGIIKIKTIGIAGNFMTISGG